jgi:hypothetical protein
MGSQVELRVVQWINTIRAIHSALFPRKHKLFRRVRIEPMLGGESDQKSAADTLKVIVRARP